MIRKRGAPVLLELIRGQAAQTPPPTRPAPVKPALPAEVVAQPKPPRVTPANPGMAIGPMKAGPAGEPIRPVAAAPEPIAIEPKRPALPVVSALESERPSAQRPQWGTLTELTRRWPWLWYAVAAVVVLAAIVWWAAFSIGHAQGRDESEDLVRRVVKDDPNAAAPTARPAPDPLRDSANTNKAPSSGPPAPPRAAPPAEAASLTATAQPETTLKAGFNYLVVATLMRRDAEESAAFLKANGIETALVPIGGRSGSAASSTVDRKAESAKDDRSQFEVLVLRGMTPAQMRAADPEIGRLETRVKTLGRKWKAENRRAPTDFAQTFWRRYRGP